MSDLRFALRSLLRNPGFTAVAVVTLALGIGVTTAIFSLVDAVLLEGPPVQAPERLAMVYTTCRDGDPRCASSYPDYRDYRDRSHSLVDLAAYTEVPVNLGNSPAPRLVTAQAVTGNYFAVLGVTPAMGRLLRPEDERPGSAEAVVVLSHDLWRGHFSAADLVGRTVLLNGSLFTVVGIAPPDFRGLDLGGTPDLWIPLLAGGALGPSAGPLADPEAVGSRSHRWIRALVGRLAEGATLSQARSEMLAISGALAEEDPAARGPRMVTVDGLGGYVPPVWARQELARFAGLLAAVVAFTLLLASANLANLLLSRAERRRPEIALRVAVGAGRARLVRQLLVESGVLALLGGGAGLLVALGTVQMLNGFALPGHVVVGSLDVRLDGRMLAIALAVSIGTGLLFGLAPALAATRPSFAAQATGGKGRSRRGRLSTALLTLQIAICLVLLVGSGLFLRTMQRALAFDPGFATGQTVVAELDLGLLRYQEPEGAAFVARLLERVRALPGVAAASVATLAPLQQGLFLGTFVEVEGYQAAADEELRVNYVFVAPDYFRALGIPLRRGRDLGPGDVAGAPRVVVVSEAMAQRWWPGRDALGGRVRLGDAELEVVGVVGDAKWRALAEPEEPYIFLPLRQYPARTVDHTLTLVARAEENPRGLLGPIREQFRALDLQISLAKLETMGEAVARVIMPQRMGALLLTLLGTLAMVLAVVGLYGVIAYRVATETRSIGIRIALGGPAPTVTREIVGRGMRAVVPGIAAGLMVAASASRFITGLMFEVRPLDPLTFAAVTLVLAGAALLACYLPARRAARIDPMEALRHE